jgi:hypothetical protein
MYILIQDALILVIIFSSMCTAIGYSHGYYDGLVYIENNQTSEQTNNV